MKQKEYFEKASKDYDKLISEVKAIDKDVSFNDDEIADIDGFMARHLEKLEDEADKRDTILMDRLVKEFEEKGKI